MCECECIHIVFAYLRNRLTSYEFRLLHSVIRSRQDQGSVHMGMRTPPWGTPLSPLPSPPPAAVINARQVLRFGRLSNIYQTSANDPKKKTSSPCLLLFFMQITCDVFLFLLFVATVKQLIQYLISQQ